jgi:endogenous inhibitor of DNA gyrase (YacG/DUF329 family)
MRCKHCGLWIADENMPFYPYCSEDCEKWDEKERDEIADFENRQELVEEEIYWQHVRKYPR